MSYLLSASFAAIRVEFFISDVWHAHEVFSRKTTPSLGIQLTDYIVFLIIQVCKWPAIPLWSGTFKVRPKNLLVEKSLVSVLKRCLKIPFWKSYRTSCKPLKSRLCLCQEAYHSWKQALFNSPSPPLKISSEVLQYTGKRILWYVCPTEICSRSQ